MTHAPAGCQPVAGAGRGGPSGKPAKPVNGSTTPRPRRADMGADRPERAHGTRARYVLGPGSGPGCRCAACTAANREAARRQTRLWAYGHWHPYVGAGPVREHVGQLARSGVGWKRAAALAGVSTGAMSKLLYGGPGDRPPSRRLRPETAAAILAVRPS